MEEGPNIDQESGNNVQTESAGVQEEQIGWGVAKERGRVYNECCDLCSQACLRSLVSERILF
jgi:hypothetical protein